MYAYISKLNNKVISVGNSIEYYDVELYSVLYEKPLWSSLDDALMFSYINEVFVRTGSVIYDISKITKEDNIRTLTVTTSTGKTFDGDETSQNRMVRAISIAAVTGLTSTSWKLYDNTITTVSLDELKEALALAGQEMSRIWLAN